MFEYLTKCNNEFNCRKNEDGKCEGCCEVHSEDTACYELYIAGKYDM